MHLPPNCMFKISYKNKQLMQLKDARSRKKDMRVVLIETGESLTKDAIHDQVINKNTRMTHSHQASISKHPENARTPQVF